MATPTLSEDNSISQSIRHPGFPTESLGSPYFEFREANSVRFADGFAKYIATLSNDRLSDFSLQHLGKASEDGRAIRQKLSDLIDSVIDEREAERAGATRTARDGHFRRQKIVRGRILEAIWELADSRIQHLVLKELAELVPQLPTRRVFPVDPVQTVATEATVQATGSTQAGKMSDDAIRRLVDQRVNELFADPRDFAFGGWFRARAKSNEVRRQQSAQDRELWGRYFHLWGCLSCAANDAEYGASGFCHNCYQRIRCRIKTLREGRIPKPRKCSRGQGVPKGCRPPPR